MIKKIFARFFQVLFVVIVIGIGYLWIKFYNYGSSSDLDDYEEYLASFPPEYVPQFPKTLDKFSSCKVFYRPPVLQGGAQLQLACLFESIEEAYNTFQQIPDSTSSFMNQFEIITMENIQENTSRYFGYFIRLEEANEQTILVLADGFENESWNHGIISKAVYIPNTRFIVYSVDAW